MKLTFLGATHEVTGSCTLIEAGGHFLLVDCGMEQGRDMFVNQTLPVDAAAIEAVILTHAHVDHSGNLPLLYKEGFRGPVYMTTGSAGLCAIMLLDCAHIQEQEAEWKSRKNSRAGKQTVEPLYTAEDAQGLLHRVVGMSYGETRQILENVRLRFTDAGHLLGAASAELWLSEGETTKKVVFSGDVGNLDRPMIRDPQPVDAADYVILESTYGLRVHPSHAGANAYVRQLTTILERTFARGGNVVIPAFTVGRTQELLYFFREIKNAGMIKSCPDFRVFVDSPMAVEATGIFLQTPREFFDDETQALLKEGTNPIWFPGLEVSVSTEESVAINHDTKPKVILSSSGMCDAGRIRHHLKHNLWRKDSTILFVGYQTTGTLGRTLLDGAKKVKLFSEEIAVNAEIAQLEGISGHADQRGLIRWLTAIPQKPEMVFINHGEDESCSGFAEHLAQEYGYATLAPYSGTVYDLLENRAEVLTEGVPIDGKRTRALREATEALNEALEKAQQLSLTLRTRSAAEQEAFTKELEALLKRYGGEQ